MPLAAESSIPGWKGAGVGAVCSTGCKTALSLLLRSIGCAARAVRSAAGRLASLRDLCEASRHYEAVRHPICDVAAHHAIRFENLHCRAHPPRAWWAGQRVPSARRSGGLRIAYKAYFDEMASVIATAAAQATAAGPQGRRGVAQLTAKGRIGRRRALLVTAAAAGRDPTGGSQRSRNLFNAISSSERAGSEYGEVGSGFSVERSCWCASVGRAAGRLLRAVVLRLWPRCRASSSSAPLASARTWMWTR